MKKILFILSILLFVSYLNAQTGIGTTTPAVKLHIKSNAATLRLEGTDHTYMELFPQGSTTRYGYIGFPNTNSTQLTFMNQFTTGAMAFGTNGTNKMYLSADGKLSIGTNTTASTLTVGAADGSVAGEIYLNPTTNQYEGGQIVFKRSLTGSTVDWTIDQYGTTSSDARLRIFNGNSENNGIAILENGNIGMGTALPTARLNIAGGGVRIFSGFGNSTSRPNLNTSSVGNYEIRGVGAGGGSSQGDGSDDGFLRLSAGGGTNSNQQASIDLSGYSQVADMGSNIVMRTAGIQRLRIISNGNVGIGTASPEASLHVAASVIQYVTSYGYLSTGGAGSGTYNQNVNYSIQADGRIRSPEFNAISDARIKTDIIQLNTQKQLSELNNLKVVNYHYIDQLANGNKLKTGFIAQEVEKVNSEFVNQSADFIPSVYAIAKSSILKDDVLKITTEKPHGFAKGDQVKFFIEGKKEAIKTVEEIISPEIFTVKVWESPVNNLFVYGKKVSDFRAIDFDQITALSVAAIQELSKQIERLKTENAELKKTLSDKIAASQLELEKRLLKLEAKLNQ